MGNIDNFMKLVSDKRSSYFDRSVDKEQRLIHASIVFAALDLIEDTQCDLDLNDLFGKSLEELISAARLGDNKLNIITSKFLDVVLPPDGVNTEREKQRMIFHAAIMEILERIK